MDFIRECKDLFKSCSSLINYQLSNLDRPKMGKNAAYYAVIVADTIIAGKLFQSAVSNFFQQPCESTGMFSYNAPICPERHPFLAGISFLGSCALVSQTPKIANFVSSRTYLWLNRGP